MSRLSVIWVTLFSVGLAAVMTQLRLNDGALLITNFQGDALHMAQGVLRLADGELPHRDFSTPLGVLAFAPIAWLVAVGFDLGAAFAYAAPILLLVMLPAVVYAGVTRFNLLGALAFSGVFVIQMLALQHGGLKPIVTVSMYYNNWCWAVSGLAVVVAVLPGGARPRSMIIDGAILGLAFAFLVLVKVTYAVFLFPAVILALLLRRDWRPILVVSSFGLVALFLVGQGYGGVAFWQGYVDDLLAITRSDIRAAPGASLASLLNSSAHLIGIGAVLCIARFLQSAGRADRALVFLLLGAGWFLITYQNWENDPHWMILAGLLAMVFSQGIVLHSRWSWTLGQGIRTCAVVLFAFAGPALFTQFQSTLLHAGLTASKYRAAMTHPRAQDLRFADKPARVSVPIQAAVGADCRIDSGMIAALAETGRALDELIDQGKTALYADWGNPLWLFSDLPPVPGGAPWYYGGTTGFDQADYMVVPLCPREPGAQKVFLKAAAGLFEEVSRTDHFILMARQPKNPDS